MKTRNDCYKAAKRIWRFWLKRDPSNYQDKIIGGLLELRVQGWETNDTKMVLLWVKAFRSGRLWPTEVDMQRLENTK